MAAAIFAGISAATGIIGGIFGASQASSQNDQAIQNFNEQKKLAKEIADRTNEYNKRAFEVDKQNYWNQYNYQWDSAVQAWQRGNEIQDFKYLQDLRAYARDLKIRDDQINFNDLGAKQAIQAEDAALVGLFQQQMFDRESEMASLKKTLFEGQINRFATQTELDSLVQKDRVGQATIQQAVTEAVKETSFKKESAMVESLQLQGQAQLRQAGKSRAKGQQATLADFYRGMSNLESSLSGRGKQAALQLMQLGLESSLAKTQLGVQQMRTDTAMLNAIEDNKFNMRVIDANVASAVEQSMRNRQDIALRQYGANLSAISQTMIRPQRLSYDPTPIKPPERVFIEPMEVLPGQVAAPVQQSVWGPIVSGFGSAAGALATIDWKSGGGKTTGQGSLGFKLQGDLSKA